MKPARARWLACQPTLLHSAGDPTGEKARRLQRAAELPGAGVLPDGRHGRPAAHPDALLHHTLGARKRASR